MQESKSRSSDARSVTNNEEEDTAEHRIKLEKGYNMQERPASEKEGEPLEIKSVTFFLKCSHCQ